MSLIKQTNEEFMEQQGKNIFDMEISHNIYFLNKKYYEKMSENQKEILKTMEKDDLKKFKTLLETYIYTAERVDTETYKMFWQMGSDCNYSKSGITKLKENVNYNIDIIKKIIKEQKEEPKPKKEEPKPKKEEPKPKKEEPKKKPAKVESESESEEEDDEEEYDKEIKKLEEKILKAKEKKEREEKKKRIEEKKAKIAQLKKQLEELEK